ncbi:hypothetical protein, partial [Sandarakinorhabdus sp.]|uniref:hypothetical protein n=1 Tax=Sandarakinorhabdus sp. TaxID=1916663 RepID=UPI00333E5558
MDQHGQRLLAARPAAGGISEVAREVRIGFCNISPLLAGQAGALCLDQAAGFLLPLANHFLIFVDRCSCGRRSRRDGRAICGLGRSRNSRASRNDQRKKSVLHGQKSSKNVLLSLHTSQLSPARQLHSIKAKVKWSMSIVAADPLWLPHRYDP